MCGPYACDRAIAAIHHASAIWKAAGNTLFNVTLSIRHRPHHDLRLQVELLVAARSIFLGSSRYKRLRRTLGIEHFIASHDETYSRGKGWHAHMHCTAFVCQTAPAQGDEDVLAKALAELAEHWVDSVRRALAKEGVPEERWHEFLPSAEQGLWWTPTNQGCYLVKRPRPRRPNQDSRDEPWDKWAIMYAAAAGDPEARRLWWIYCEAMSGKDFMTGLNALKKAFGYVEPPKATTENDKTIADIPIALFNEVSRMPEGRPRTLEGAERDGLRGAATAIASIRRYDWTWDPSPSESSVRFVMRLIAPRPEPIPGGLPAEPLASEVAADGPPAERRATDPAAATDRMGITIAIPGQNNPASPIPARATAPAIAMLRTGAVTTGVSRAPWKSLMHRAGAVAGNGFTGLPTASSAARALAMAMIAVASLVARPWTALVRALRAWWVVAIRRVAGPRRSGPTSALRRPPRAVARGPPAHPSSSRDRRGIPRRARPRRAGPAPRPGPHVVGTA